ncbi:hypothetical protein pb186bvf_010590, partial [Paramecium bursaria]
WIFNNKYNLLMNKSFIHVSLRGGGVSCSSSSQKQGRNQLESVIDEDMIQSFIFDVGKACQDINDQSQTIGSKDSQDQIIKQLRWFTQSSQFINQVNKSKQKIRENIKMISSNLDLLLDAALNTIQSQRYIALQILKVCNQFSRLIFIYYVNNPKPPLTQEKQQQIQQVLNSIMEFLNLAGESQLYYNSLYYELYVVKICIDTCPNDSKEGQEILINTFKGIAASITEMSPSPELLSALADGAIYLLKENQKRKQKNIFQAIYYLEELKWEVIERIQQGKGINRILSLLGENYNKLVKKSSDWLIKCCWIKIISETIIYRPIVIKTRIVELISQYKLQADWDQLLIQKILIPLDKNKQIGVIQICEENSQINRVLQQQITKFNIVQTTCIKGSSDIPSIDSINKQEKSNVSQLQIQYQEKHMKLLELIQSIPYQQYSIYLQQTAYKCLNLAESIYSLKKLLEGKDQIDRQYLLGVVEQITYQLEIFTQEYYQIIQINEVVLSQIQNIIQQVKLPQNLINTKFYQIIRWIINYYEIYKQIDFTDKLQDNFKEMLKKVNNLEQTEQLYIDLQKIVIKEGEIENLIQQLDLLKQKYETSNLKEFNRYIKIIDELKWDALHVKISEDIITPQLIQNQRYLQLKSLIQNNKFLNEQIITKIKLVISESSIDQVMELYAKLQLLSDIYKEQSQLSEETLGSELQHLLRTDQDIEEVQITQLIKCAESYLQKELNYYLDGINKVYVNWVSVYKKEQINNEEVLEELESIEVLYQFSLGKIDGYQQQIISQIALINQQLSNSEEQNYFQQKLSQITLNFQDLMQENLEQSQFYELLKIRITLLNEVFDQLEAQVKTEIGPDIENLLIIQDNYQKQWCSIKIDQIKESLSNNQNIINKLRDQDILIKSQVIVDSKKELLNGHLQIYQQIQKYVESLKILQNHKQLIETLEDINKNINDIKIQKYLKVFDDKEKLSQKLGKINSFIENNFKVDVQQFQQIFEKKPSEQQLSQNSPASQEVIQTIIKPYKELQKMQQQKDSVDPSRNAGALQKVKDIYQNELWRIKDYTYLCWLQILPYLQQDNQKVIGQLLILARFKETDFRIVATLKNKEQIQQMEALINNQWEDSEEQVKLELQNTLNQLQAIQLQLQSEERKEVRDQLLQQHKDIESQLEQQLKNVNEIGDILGITINFMKDIKKDLQAIQSKLDNIINSLDQIGQDLKFLRGKTPQQLIEIRMQNILQNKMIQDSSSVYVQIRTKEYNLKDNRDEYQETPLFNYEKIKNGEVDEFLNEQKKVSLLIHGPAGSGKSLTSRKIEEYLWLLYKQQCNGQLWKDLKDVQLLIPIFIQLPTLKEPKFQAVEETLQSSLYRFDQKQIDQLRDSVQNGTIKLIFIMDSYDELASGYQGCNLIQTNKLYLWKQQGQKHPRVISTSRTEAFTTPDFRQWFYENDQNGIQSLKEIKLLPFDDSQRLEFLLQFSLLKLKISIYELLQVISKSQQNQQIIQDTALIWEQIQPIIQYSQNNKSSFLLNEEMAMKIIDIIKKNPNVIQLNQEQEVSFKKSISTIWNQQQYNICINQMGLVEILETPFMMNIVVEVLPQMNNEIAQPNTIKQYFFKNYLKLKQQQIDSIIKLDSYKSFYISTKYSDEQIQSLKNLTEAQLIQQSVLIWDNLTEANFFSQWNYQQQYDDLIQLLKKFQSFSKYDDDELFIILQALKSHKLTIYNFFQSFFQQYIEIQRSKMIYSNDIVNQSQFENDIYQYSIKLAELMMMRQETIIEIKQKGILFRENTHDPYQQYFEDQDKYGKYRQSIRKCMPLRQKGDYFSFNHKSIQEYLFSKDILNLFYQILELKRDFVDFIDNYRESNKQVDVKALVIPEQLQQEMLQSKVQRKQSKEEIISKLIDKILHSSLNQINLNDTFYKGTFKFLRIQFAEITELLEILDVTILLSSICQELIQFSSNSLLIIIGIKQNLFGKNYSKVKIDNLSLDGISFINCNLSDTLFNRISINGINLNQSNLTNIRWTYVFSSDLPNLRLPSYVTKIDVSPTEDRIVSCSGDKKMIVWDSKTFQKVKEIENSDQIAQVKYSNNGKMLYIYSRDKQIKLFNSQDLTLICQEPVEGYISGLASFSSNDKNIAICQQKEYQPTITIRDTQKLSIIKYLSYDIYECKALQYHSDNHLYCVMDKYNYDALCVVQSVESGEVRQKFVLSSAMRCAFISPDCSFLVMASLYVGDKWNIINQSHIATYAKGHTREILYADFTEDGNTIITCGEDKSIIIWDAKSGSQLATLIHHTDYVNQVKVTKDQKMIISAGKDGQIKIWDASVASRSSQQQSIALKEIKSVAYSVDGKLIAIGSFGNQIVIYDSQTYDILQTIKTYSQYSEGLSFHPNNRYLLYGAEGSYYIWNLIEKKQIYRGYYPSQIYATKYSILGNFYFISNAALGTTYLSVYNSQNNEKVNQFDSSNYDFYTYWSNKIENQIITVWKSKTSVTNCQTGEIKVLIEHKEHFYTYNLSYDSNYLVGITNKIIEIWDLNSASLKKSINIKVFDGQNIVEPLKVAISPNADIVAAAFKDKTIRIWDVTTGVQVGESLQGHLADVKWLIFNPNGEQLLSSAENSTTVIWNKNSLFGQKQDLKFDPNTLFIENVMIPQQTSHKTLINGSILKNSQIQSHLGFELVKIWKDKQMPNVQQQK